jgi:NADPH2:quinone reductase
VKAVVYEGTGGVEVIRIREVQRPVPTRGALLVRVRATALNRGDILQRQGEYRIPRGQSTIPGVEVAGTVEALGEGATRFAIGQGVFGVVEGGGFAEYCLVDERMANPIPDGFSLYEAAATAESGLTANETLFTLGGLAAGDGVLIHAGASSVGTTMMQMAKRAGATAYATVGSSKKADAIRGLRADAVINYSTEDFVAEVLRLTGGVGVQLVMDFVGGAYLGRNLAALRAGGCLVVVGLLDGLSAELDLLRVVERRLSIKGSSLRLRPLTEKRQVNARFRARWGDELSRGTMRPVVHAVYPIEQLASAQAEMEANANVGKIVLSVA